LSDNKEKEIIEVKEVEAERINNNETFRPRFIIAFLGLIFFPFILALAPWYAALANHDFYPLLIVYGGLILGTLFFRIAMRSTFKR
jgi:hypothetical protein